MKRLITLNIVLVILLMKINAQEQSKILVRKVTSEETGIRFSADILPSSLNLDWTVSPSDPAECFQLERSADSMNFITLETFSGQPGQTYFKYFFHDDFPLRKSNFYRLLAIEKGGNEKRSVDLHVEFNSKPRTIKPNLLIQGAQY